MPLLEQNKNKIFWEFLSKNSSALHLLEQNKDKIDWFYLSQNQSAMHLLEQNQDKIDWHCLSINPSIFELDYNALKERCSVYKEELIQVALHPSRIQKYLEQGINFAELDDFI